MVSGEELVARLRTADEAWSTVQGTSRHWRRRDLVNLAFARHFDHPARQPGWTMSFSSAGESTGADDDEIVEAILAVAFDAHGRRRRALTVSRRREQWLPDLVVVDGPTFWARTGTIVQTNGGDERHGYGGTDIVNLLLPSRVPDGYHLRPTDEEERIAGRRCLIATATPRKADPSGRTPGAEVFDMITGGTLFRLGVDLQTGALLRVVKLVDGAEAEVCEFLDITIDAPLDTEVFTPLT